MQGKLSPYAQTSWLLAAIIGMTELKREASWSRGHLYWTL